MTRENCVRRLHAPVLFACHGATYDTFVFIQRDATLRIINTFIRHKGQGYEFQPVAVETHGRDGPLSVSSVSFLVDLMARKISERTGEPLEVQFLFQGISVLIQRFNSVLFHETFPVEDDTDT